jgi:hypothetical protein
LVYKFNQNSARSWGIEKPWGFTALNVKRGPMNPFQKPNPQAPPNPNPPNNQVPDHRIDQMVERMRLLELQNSQLRGQIDVMARPAQQPGQPPAQPLFKPEVQQAIAQLVEEKLNTERVSHRQQIGWLADQLDQAKFQTNYGGEKFAKLIPKVDQLRQEYQAQNKYITREDALRMVYFEETGKKSVVPDPAPAPQAPPQPVYDRYLGQYVDPRTGRPADPQAYQQEEIQEEQPQESFQPTPPAQGWQPPQATPHVQQNTGGMYPGQRIPPGAASPNGNAYGQNFSLPQQGINPPSAAQHVQTQRGPLSIEATDSDLKAFEAKYGDIPL